MKTLLTGLLLLFTVSAFAANPAFESFPTNQFNRNNVTLTYREGKTLFVDSVYGNDTIAHRTNGIPFRTPVAAKTNALAGDLIMVREGVYTNGVTNLFKGGVDWHFDNCELQWTDPTTNGHGSGIFDDRFSGAVTTAITGSLTIRYSTGTNGYFGDGCETYFGNYLNNLAPIVLTNAGTLVRWSAATTVYLYGPTAGPFVLYVLNCQSNTFFNIDYAYNGSPWGTAGFTVTNCPASPGDPIVVSTFWSFLYWEQGTLHVNFKHVGPYSSYAVNAYSDTTNDVADLYLNGDLMEGKIYLVGLTPAWKTWMNIGQLMGRNQIAMEYSGGTHYLTSQKVSSDTTVFLLSNQTSNGVLHASIQKVASSVGWIESNGASNILRGTIDEFESTANNMAVGIINRTNSLIDISGRHMSNALYCVFHNGGTTRLADYRVISTNRPAIFVNAPGFVAQNLVVVSPTNSITATNATEIRIYNHMTSNTNEHDNVTISTGTLTVNGVVQ